MARLEWRGDEVRERVLRAAAEGMNQVEDMVAEAARHDHPGWQSRTGQAEASIAAVPARRVDGALEAAVGFAIARGRFLEFTTRGHPGDRTITRAFERISRDLTRRIRARLGT